MHRRVEQRSDVAENAGVSSTLISTDPSTGEQLWSGKFGDAAAEVAAARAAWPVWAAHSHAYRIEALRRFANVVRKKEAQFAELIARETGKPLGRPTTEVGAVINKVDISIEAYAERTPQRRLEAAMTNKIAVSHKPHGVIAVLGPYNFPAHLPNGHIVPALIAGNAVVFKPSEKTPASGEFLVQCYHEAGIPEGVVRLLSAVRTKVGRLPVVGHRRAAVHRLRTCRHGASPAVCGLRTSSWRSSLAAITPLSSGSRRTGLAAAVASAVRLSLRGPALHRRASADRRRRQARGADRCSARAR